VSRPKPVLLACALALGAVLSACGEGIEIDEKSADDPLRKGAVLFTERCSGCHTLTAAGTQGSKPSRQLSGGERSNGPNFNTRKESRDDVLFAIRNGGFSGAIMPANIVVGQDAEHVADFVAKYAGRKSSGAAGDQTD
jgi:mono/diheme cytochrome c family protein